MPPLLIPLLGHTRSFVIGVHESIKNLRVSLVTRLTQCVARMGRRLRVSACSSPMTLQTMLPWGMHKPWAESNSYKISELFPFTAAGPPAVYSSSLPLCIRFNQRLRRMPYTLAAILDTGRVASAYPGGISPRSSIRPCQSARACHCSASRVTMQPQLPQPVTSRQPYCGTTFHSTYF